MRRLDGKIALVTGAASGIGQAAAQRFAAEGAHVCLFDRNADGLAQTGALIAAEGGESAAFTLDLTNETAVKNAVDEAATRWGGLEAIRRRPVMTNRYVTHNRRGRTL